ncbi:MAG: hypothetical protein SNJ81_11660 [Cyanobacteriota bacterium]
MKQRPAGRSPSVNFGWRRAIAPVAISEKAGTLDLEICYAQLRNL